MQGTYELKLEDGKVVTWDGKDGVDACKRYVDCKGGAVVAWREVQYGLFLYNPANSIVI